MGAERAVRDGDVMTLAAKLSEWSSSKPKLLKMLRDTICFLECEEVAASNLTETSSTNRPEQLIRTAVVCGLTMTDQERTYTAYSEYFGCDVDVYTAVSDRQKQVLVKAATLTKKTSSSSNMVGMYLARHRKVDTGIFQATMFLHKPNGRCGLKVGGYFVSEAACRRFETYLNKSSTKSSSTPAKSSSIASSTAQSSCCRPLSVAASIADQPRKRLRPSYTQPFHAIPNSMSFKDTVEAMASASGTTTSSGCRLVGSPDSGPGSGSFTSTSTSEVVLNPCCTTCGDSSCRCIPFCRCGTSTASAPPLKKSVPFSSRDRGIVRETGGPVITLNPRMRHGSMLADAQEWSERSRSNSMFVPVKRPVPMSHFEDSSQKR